MRTAYVLLPLALSQAGCCSSFVASSGQDLASLKTRTQVQAAFGEPTAAASVGGRRTEVYDTRRKIAEPGYALSYCFAAYPTLGLSECVFLPYELGKAGTRALVGQRVTFAYDDVDAVTEIRFNGRPLQPQWQSGYSFGPRPSVGTGP